MPFFKLKQRTRSPSASKVSISKPVPSASHTDLRLSSDRTPSPKTMDNDRRSPSTPFKIGGSYQPVNRPVPLGRVPSSPLPPLPTYDSGYSPNNYGDSEVGFTRGVAKFERVRMESHESSQMLLSPTKSPMGQISADTDELTQFAPMSTSPPKLRLSFESDITEAGSVYDLDTLPNHRVSLKATLKKPVAPTARPSSPERIITSPVKIAQSNINTDPRSRPRTSSNGPAQLKRSSALYSKRSPSTDGTDVSFSIKSGKSGKLATENPEDRDSGFHEDFDETLRSKPPSPDKQLFDAKTNNLSHQRNLTNSPDRMAITPEHAPLIPAEGRITPITLTDPGVTVKRTRMTLPQIERMETFKETFSTNLFENTISPDVQRNLLLSPKPIVSATQGKVMTPAEFEKLRQQEEDDSEDDEEEEDIARDENYQVDLAKQRQRQQAALSIYRQQMTKVVGATSSPKLKPERPGSQFKGIPEEDDESEEIPLGILMAHGFPQTNTRPSSSQSQSHDRSMSLDAKRTPSPGNLPVFAKNLPSDPHSRGIPRSTSAYELRPSTTSTSLGLAGSRTVSASAVPLLDTYQTRQRKGASYLGPNVSFNSRPQIMGNEQSYFSQVPGQYDMMGMQPIHNQGRIQYVPVMVSPPRGSPMGSPMGSPQLAPMQPPTLIHELQSRQQYGMQQQQQQRMSQYIPQPPPHIHPVQRFPQSMQSRPQSIYPTSRQSVYDQKSIYSLSSQQPTPRPKLPSTNPAYRLSTMSSNSSQPGRYRASTYDTSALGVPPQLRISASDDDEGWEGLKRKKEQLQARRMTRLQAA